GSTITMQVARLLHPHPRSVPGKLSQILRAIQLEWHLDKQEILALYLNNAPFGGTLEGVEAAAFGYFNKSAAQLSHAEAALLAVLPQAPSRFRPDRHPGRAEQARNKVLQRLGEFQIWTEQTVLEARQEKVAAFGLQSPQLAPLLARRLMQDNPESLLQTTLEFNLQQRVQDYVKLYTAQLPAHSSVAVLIVENQNMEARAYVGSGQFGNTQRFGYIDMVTADRSPGSTLKPFLYGMAIDAGLIHSHSLLTDTPRSYGLYQPDNFSGGFNGPVSATAALQKSLNIPAVDLLARLGPKTFVSRLQHIGIPLTLPNHEAPGLALILGGTGTSLEALVSGFASLARGGLVAPVRYQHHEPLKNRHLFSEGTAWVIHRILQDSPHPDQLRTRRARGSNTDNPGIAWKTGTSYGYRDAWSIGVSPEYTIGVWVGRPDGAPVPGHFGAVTATPLMFTLFKQMPARHTTITRPGTVTDVEICWPTGTQKIDTLPKHCHKTLTSWSVDKQVPPTYALAQENQVDRSPLTTIWINPETGLRVDQNCVNIKRVKRRVALWPGIVEPWLPAEQKRGQQVPPLDPRCEQPAELSGQSLVIHKPETDTLIQPPPGSNELPTISLSTLGGIEHIGWYVNGQLWKQTAPNQSVAFKPEHPGKFEFVAVDGSGNTDRRILYFTSSRRPTPKPGSDISLRSSVESSALSEPKPESG
ncbi:MAG: penicillin-binding protein 1C, partial [Pseudomonadales bacterium]|nr:penicillin-binding protein 1C [Pseudomonadales bacterium]